MAWKLRKDKLKAGAEDAESPEAAESAAPEAATEPVFDLSGSAFLTDTGSGNNHGTEEPHVAEEDLSPVFFSDEPRFGAKPTVHEPIVLGSEPIALDPLPTEQHPAVSFSPDPLPEFDPVVLTSSEDLPPEPIALAPDPAPEIPQEPAIAPPPVFAPDPPPAPVFAPDILAQREAIAPALVTTDSDSGLPKVAPFIVDTPAATQFHEEPERAHSVTIRIGNLSANVPLTKPITTIGRPDSIVENYPDMEVELDDGVSRRHAEIRQENGQFFIMDTHSTNGTFLNGEKLTPDQPVPLRPGDRIRIGERTELVFE